MNDKFVFISGLVCDESFVFLILDREDDNNLYKYFKSDLEFWFVFCKTQICGSPWYEDIIYVYDINPSNSFATHETQSEFKNIYRISDCKFIYGESIDIDGQTLKFNKY